MKRAGTISLLICLNGYSATYHVATTGDNSNDGSTNSPWASYIHAQSNCLAGDTVIVMPGIYNGAGQTNAGAGYATFNISGATNNPKIFRAAGGVTNQFCFYVTGDGFYFDGFTWSGMTNVSCVWADLGADFVTVTNCTFSDVLFAIASRGCVLASVSDALAPDPTNAARSIKVRGCTFDRVTNGVCVQTGGIDSLIDNNHFRNTSACDIIKPWGSNTTIRCNTFSNLLGSVTYGNHPDLMQVFGDSGNWMAGAVFERNYVVDCPGPAQFMDFSYSSIYPANPLVTIPTNVALWGMTLRNNLFVNSKMQCSIAIPNVRWYNNTFYKCTNGSLLIVNYWDLGDPWNRGTSYGGQCFNNAFAETPGSPYVVYNTASRQGDLTTDNAGGGDRTGSGYIRLDHATGGGGEHWYVYATYSGLSGGVSNGIISHYGVSNLYVVALTNFSNGICSAIIPWDYEIPGYDSTKHWQIWYSNLYAFTINTTNFPSGEIASTNLQQGQPSPPIDYATNFNYIGGIGGAVKAGFSEPDGINGGDPMFVSATNNDLSLLTASPLVDSGTNALVTLDFFGVPRPSGTLAIGALEDSKLLVRYSFDDDFTNADYIMDQSGGNRHAWKYGYPANQTNWPRRIEATNTPGGVANMGYCADFYWYQDGWGVYGESGDYAGITTNTATITNMNVASIMAWMRYQSATRINSTNTWADDNAARWLSSGDAGVYLGAWGFGRRGSKTPEFYVLTNADGNRRAYLSYPVSSGNDGDSTNWHHVAMTWTNGNIVGYLDGLTFTNTTFGVTNLTTYCYSHSYPWIALGCDTHGGTPPLEDETGEDYPNGGWMNGLVDDVRIYNRVLSAEEVAWIGGGSIISSAEEAPGGSTNIAKKAELRGSRVTPRGKVVFH